jgi:methionyl-tRNA synthetase
MLKQYFNSTVPEASGAVGLCDATSVATSKVETAYENLEFHTALGLVWEIVSLGNRVIEEQKPWAKIKAGDEASRAQVATLLHELLQVCAWASLCIAPVMPHVAQQLRDLLNIETELRWSDAHRAELLPAGHICREPQPLFPRLLMKASTQGKTMNEPNPNELLPSPAPTLATNSAASPNAATNNEMIVEAGIANHRTNGEGAHSTSATASVTSTAPNTSGEEPVSEEDNYIEYADFAKVELRAAKILEAERIPKADKLLKLQVDLGTEKRQILAGIAQQFEPEQLIGKTIVVVVNLAPRTMRGLQSQGMLLAASATADGPPVGLLTVDADVLPGSIIR